MTKWIDVGTTALPRLLTERCIGSFLDMMDYDGYRLRWIFHLDVLPDQPWSDLNWRENVAQAERIARRFDDAILLLPLTNQSYGRACFRVFQESGHDLLWIEDDWHWQRPFRLAAVEAAARDGYNFHRGGVRIGATSPTFWKRHVVQHLLAQYPQPPESASELRFKRILHRRARFRNNMHRGGIPKGVTVDVGRESLYGGRWP